jgi:hypothetical protein
MATFSSSQFSKTTPNPQMREFNIGEPEQSSGAQPSAQFDAQLDAEKSIREAREVKNQEIVNGGARINPDAKKRIEILSNIGRMTRDVKMGDHTFTIRTLKAKEAREAALATFSSVDTQLEASYEARRQQLARSIYQIDGHSVNDVIGASDMASKLSWIDDNLEDIVVNKLFSEFNSLKEEAQNKYGIASAEQAKEVVEDLKK